MQTANADESRSHPEGARFHQRAEGSRAEHNEPRPMILYPEHGTGRAAQLTKCGHCGRKPSSCASAAATGAVQFASVADSTIELSFYSADSCGSRFF